MKTSLKIAAVQFNSNQSDKKNNLERMRVLVAKAAAEKVDVISFPEICITGYNFILYTKDVKELLAIAEHTPQGPCTQEIAKWAVEFNITILFGLLEKDENNKLWNTFVCVQPNGSFHKYRKIHAFENSHMSQGAEFPCFDIQGWKCGVLICFDNNLPENTLMYALQNCEILFAPHQTGAFDVNLAGMGRIDINLWKDKEKNKEKLYEEFMGPKGREWLLKWFPSRAYDNNMYHIFSNGVGLDHDELRTGNAMIIDPHGIVVAESRSIDPDYTVATLDKKVREKTLGGMHLLTRNPHLYKDLSKEQLNKLDTRNARNSLTENSQIV